MLYVRTIFGYSRQAVGQCTWEQTSDFFINAPAWGIPRRIGGQDDIEMRGRIRKLFTFFDLPSVFYLRVPFS